jgi:hypothetical protein
MFHPFEGDLTQLKDTEVEERLFELNKKYYAAYRLGNQDLLTQVAIFVNIYKDELNRRNSLRMKGQLDGDLDQLINVD